MKPKKTQAAAAQKRTRMAAGKSELPIVTSILEKTANTLETLIGEIRILAWRLDRLEESAKKTAGHKNLGSLKVTTKPTEGS